MPISRSRSSLVLLLALGALGAFVVSRPRPVDPTERARLATNVGAMPLSVAAPQVQLWNRADVGVPLASYRGRLVFVNFWATWCGPCVAEMPSLIALQRSLDPADIAFVSIAEDDTWPPVDAYLRRDPLPFDVYRDRPPRVEEQFETTAYPTSFLIDRDGQALYRFNGGRNWDTREVRELLALEGVHPLPDR